MNVHGGMLHPGLTSVLDTALDAVCIMDRNGSITGWNACAAALFGWSSDEAVGQRLSELIVPPDMREAHERGLAHYLATGDGPVLDHRIEVNALDRSGDELPVELCITASEQFGELLFIGFLRDISERKAVAERQQRRLQESDHRVKNMLTVVSAIAGQTARSANDMEDFLERFSGRLDSLAKAHSLLAGTKLHDVGLASLAEQVLDADVLAGRAHHSGPDVQLAPQHLLGVSMILHELYTNAVKYGALCTDQGTVDLRWWVVDDEVMLIWTEHGPACPARTPSSGLGQRMIDLAVRSDLNGTIERDWTSDGLVVTIRFPLAG